VKFCGECYNSTPSKQTTVNFREVTLGIATEIFCDCNVETEHHGNHATHQWTQLSAEHRVAPKDAPEGSQDTSKPSMASFSIN
jgi:hypothetical protein